MKSFAVMLALAAMLGVGLIALDGGGDKVRGEKGKGSVNQEWVDSNSWWHY